MDNSDYGKGYGLGPEALESARKLQAEHTRQLAFKRDQEARFGKLRPYLMAFAGGGVGVVLAVATSPDLLSYVVYASLGGFVGWLLAAIFWDTQEKEMDPE